MTAISIFLAYGVAIWIARAVLNLALRVVFVLIALGGLATLAGTLEMPTDMTVIGVDMRPVVMALAVAFERGVAIARGVLGL